ncbi:MAG: Gfo/Idh/MocA family oxidoreductase [Planctomycetes bacterium]|nr:Gfo/Idh/MocA family oxidoreductase [Planctomycetota bacterium]
MSAVTSSTSATKPLRGAIIGCGDISPDHGKAYAEAGIVVAAVCDLDRVRAERRAKEFGTSETTIHTDHREVLARADIDLVTVATPVAGHAPVTIAALQAGKHVACEKPSTLSPDENRAIIAAERASGKRVVFFSSRYRYGAATLARDYIAAGELGDIYRVDMRFYRRRGRPGVDIIPDARWFIDSTLAGGGVIMDMGQYFIDNTMSLTGWPRIATVSATTFRGFPHQLPAGTTFDVEEHCSIFARAENGCSFSYDLAWMSHHPPMRTLTILGTKGGIRMTDEQPFCFHTEKGPWKFVDTTTPWRDDTRQSTLVYRDLIAAIAGNDPGVGTTPTQALALTEITRAALQSAKEGREIALAPAAQKQAQKRG